MKIPSYSQQKRVVHSIAIIGNESKVAWHNPLPDSVISITDDNEFINVYRDDVLLSKYSLMRFGYTVGLE